MFIVILQKLLLFCSYNIVKDRVKLQDLVQETSWHVTSYSYEFVIFSLSSEVCSERKLALLKLVLLAGITFLYKCISCNS